jgi:hypothetical protein
MGMCAAGVLVGSIFLGADTNYWAVETCLLEILVEQIGEITIRPGWYVFQSVAYEDIGFSEHVLRIKFATLGSDVPDCLWHT